LYQSSAMPRPLLGLALGPESEGPYFWLLWSCWVSEWGFWMTLDRFHMCIFA